jgi:hypothetical protein
MPTSPDTLNYSVLKGQLYFTPTAGTERSLGNAPVFQLSPEIERLDHFSSMAGVKAKDRSIILERTLTANITLDEITAENLAIALLGGTVAAGPPKTFDLFVAAEITGSLRFAGSNAVGNKVDLDLPNVSFGPAGEIDFISDEWGQIELEAQVLYDTVSSGFGTCTVTDAVASVVMTAAQAMHPAAQARRSESQPVGTKL